MKSSKDKKIQIVIELLQGLVALCLFCYRCPVDIVEVEGGRKQKCKILIAVVHLTNTHISPS